MKQIFQTEDGKTFTDAAEAEKHETFLREMKPAEDYKAALEKAGWKGAALTRQYNAGKAFLAWNVAGTVPALPEKSKEKVKK